MTVKFPEHKASLSLTHNDHKSYYKTVQEFIDEGDYDRAEHSWVSAEQRQKAIDTNECWVLQWYPETPVGYSILFAADLDALLAAALATEAPR